MSYVFDVFQTGIQSGLLPTIILSLLVVIGWLVGREISRLIRHHYSKTEEIDKLFAAICDPENPQRIYKRTEIIRALENIQKRLDTFEDCMANKQPCIKELSVILERHREEAKIYGQNRDAVAAEMRQTIGSIIDELRKVSDELLGLVRLLIERMANGKGLR